MRCLLVTLLLLCSGDIEPNPGPFWKKDEDAIENLQDVIDDQADEIKDLKETVDQQNETIEELRTKIEDILTKVDEQKEKSEKTAEELASMARSSESEKQANDKAVDKLTSQDSRISQELLQQKETMNEALTDLVRDINMLRNQVGDIREKTDQSEDNVSGRMKMMFRTVEELREKTWELDTSTRNNLVFYGLKDAHGHAHGADTAEWMVKELLKTQLHISRDTPFIKVTRATEEEKGVKPVTVQFEKYTDKTSVLQRAKMLKGTNVLISEDFPKRVRERRAHLIQFAKQVRKRRPDTRFNMQYDKLYVNSAAYVYNEETGEIEMLSQVDTAEDLQKTPGPRKKVSPYGNKGQGSHQQRRGRLAKSNSTDSDFLHVRDGSPLKNGFSQIDPMLEAELDEDTSDTLGDSLELES